MKIGINSIYLLLILSVFMVGISAYITHRNTLEKQRDTQMVFRRYQSIESSTELLSLIKDMETGQRGYIITGDSDFLEPYSEARSVIQATKDSLRNLIDDNEHRTSLKRLFTTLENKTRELENIVTISNTFGQDSAVKRVETGIGMAHMDTLRTLIQELIQRERTLLTVRNQELEKNTRVEDTARFFAFALIGLTSLAALITLIRKQNSIKKLIEELQKANEELELKVGERTKQLVEANQAKDHFLGIASHDLNAPISGILGFLELMKLENGNRSETETEYLSYMRDSCNSMQRLISNLLDVNRIERGATIIKKDEVDLKSLLTRIETNFTHQAKKKNIELFVDKPESSIQTDRDALTRILENLLSNAIKFSLTDRSVQLKTVVMGDQVKFEIIDKGPGIPPEEMPNLFGKFQKLSNRPTGGEGSTGLGLSIVRELAHLLGGDITVTSRVGYGTTFTLIMPVKNINLVS
jgi:signal transduction histidine kinase